MLIIPPIPSSSAIRTEVIPDVTKIWKVGQVLSATAERGANARDNILLRMGQSILEAKTPIALKAGDSLQLVVKSLGETPVLKIQTTVVPSSPSLVAQNLKSFIAQQRDLTGLLQLSQVIIESPSIPKIIKQQLANLQQQLPTAEQLMQAKTLKKIIQNNGIFLESRLKHQADNTLRQEHLQQDVKSQLLKISAQLRSLAPELTIQPQTTNTSKIQFVINQFIKGEINLNQLSTLLTNQLSTNHKQLIQQFLTAPDKTLLPKELLGSFSLLLKHSQRQARPLQLQENLSDLLKSMDLLQKLKTNLDGALARITSQQLTIMSRETDNLLLLLFDLTIKDKTENNLIKFRFEQEKRTDEQGESNWLVSLDFNFKELGPVQAKLHLTGNNMSTVFHAEKESTVKNISKQINVLETAFENIGFDAINIGVSKGDISQPGDLPKNIRMLDERA